MLTPVNSSLQGVVGAEWDWRFIFTSEGEPYDLSQAYDVDQIALEIDGVLTVTAAGVWTVSPSGTVTPEPVPAGSLAISEGTVDATLLAQATSGIHPSGPPWRIRFVRLDGTGPDYPINGRFFWRAP